MNVVLKQKLKRLVPPALLDAVSPHRSRPRFGATYRKGGARLASGIKFELRETRADHDVFRQIFIDDEYSLAGFPQSSTLNAWYRSQPNSAIIDAGANIGASAVWLSMCFPHAKVIAVEPDPGNFELLKRNAQPHPNVLPVHAAIASKAGHVYLVDTGDGAWAFRTIDQPTPGAVQVPAMTVEELVALVPDAQPLLMKVDIEGAEVDLFSTPSPWISRFPVVAIELHDWMLPRQASSKNFLRWHVEHERDLVYRGENAFSVTTGMPPLQNAVAAVG